MIILASIVYGCKDNTQSHSTIIGFSQGLNNHAYRSKMNHDMQVHASLFSDINLLIYQANGNIAKQQKDVDEMISNGAEAVIISPIDQKSLAPQLERLKKHNIPVILLDRTINSGNYTSYVGADNAQIGRAAAQFIISDTGDYKKKVIEIAGGDNSSPSTERSTSFQNVIAEHNIPLIKSFKGLNEKDFERYLTTLPKEDYYLFAFNDEIAMKAWQILRKKNLQSNFKIIGVDGLDGRNGGIDMVMDGKLQATFLYPTGASEALELARSAAKGMHIPKRVVLSSTQIDISNAQILLSQLQKISQQQGTIENQVKVVKAQMRLYSSQKNLLTGAVILLILMVASVGYCTYLIFEIKKKNRKLVISNHKITIQRNEIQKIAAALRESNETRMTFFTGLSHEFKTPITLILGALETLKSRLGKNATNHYELHLISNNSARLLRLINNLLDFRKIQDRAFNLRVSRTNIYDFTCNLYQEFLSEARRRNIDYKIICDNTAAEVYIDRNLMDKVYFNLLSNALKFTPDNGKIEISIHDMETSLQLSFKDNGIGIPEDEIENVFTPYFKGSNNRKSSSGIGLHLSKTFIELHLGKIEVQSNHGTEFIITLHKGDKHFNEDQKIKEAEVVVLEEEITDGIDNTQKLSPENLSNLPIVLVVEDNSDMRLLLSKILCIEYNVELCDDTDAVEKAQKLNPALIICDVNLPHKSGFEICAELKNDFRTSHHPVILLTAMNAKEMVIKGLQSGADAYITKPFSTHILHQMIKNLLFNREVLRYYYTNNLHKINNVEGFDNAAQQFVTALNKIILENLSKPEFAVENLAASMKMSRIQLYRKIKALFDVSASDYIAEMRLNEASKLLREQSYPISEIAYRCGFSSPNYFSTAFKSKFGLTPINFRKSQSL